MKTSFESRSQISSPELTIDQEAIVRVFAETLAEIDGIPEEIQREVAATPSGKASGSDNEGNGYSSYSL